MPLAICIKQERSVPILLHNRITVRIEWDEAKNVANQQKHDGIDFQTAARVFNDPNLVLVEDRIDDQTGEHGCMRLVRLA